MAKRMSSAALRKAAKAAIEGGQAEAAQAATQKVVDALSLLNEASALMTQVAREVEASAEYQPAIKIARGGIPHLDIEAMCVIAEDIAELNVNIDELMRKKR
jgi:predicted ATP-grasp superfamily ATP-dependent carboligase